jgi:hypothetical protein
MLLACNKEAALTPSTPATVILLPQGSNSYDDSIVACYNKYRIYILYRFSQADYGYDEVIQKTDSAFNGNPAYISPALQLVYEHLFNVLPESFLQRTIPYKILLASYIGSNANRSTTGFAYTYASLTIGWTDSILLKLSTPAVLKTFRINLLRAYMDRALRATAMQVPADFKALQPSKITYGGITSTALKNQYGIIETPSASLTINTDFLGYVQAIATRTKADIENTYFKSSVDVNGLYKKKYNVVISYFKTEFGFDLQELGNTF